MIVVNTTIILTQQLLIYLY